MDTINEHCPVCGDEAARLLYDVRNPKAHQAKGLHGVIKQCSRCRLMYKTFDRRAADVYDDTYAEAFLANPDYSGAAAVALYSGILEPAFRRATRHTTSPRLLDVGSGFGMMLQTAHAMGFSPAGVELCQPLADRAREHGFTVYGCDVADLRSDLMFDVITMMDIIEHLVDPVAVLESLRRRLKPTGELVLYTPDHGSLIVSVASWLHALGFPSAIDNIFACTHTCFFTADTLRATVERAGFDVLEVRTLPYDTSRTGQPVSATSKLLLNAIETTGRALGYNGFRVILYVSPKGPAVESA